jgi:hypothetical protein
MKVITEKRYELKEIGNSLLNKDVKERSQIKAKALSKAVTRSFSRDGFEVNILSIGYEKDLLRLIVEVKKDGVLFFVDNPLYYHNPPIMIHDGTYHIAKDHRGQNYEHQNFVEDIEESLKEIIIQTLKYLNKQQ